MRDLTPDEKELWMRVTTTVTALGDNRRPAIDAPFQFLNPIPAWVLDLHGLTVWNAFQETKSFVEKAYFAQVRRVTVITGRSGVIRDEFVEWVSRYPVQRYELLNGGGAFRLFINKKPQKTAKS